MINKFDEQMKNIEDYDVVIIDEFSMLDQRMFHKISNTCISCTENEVLKGKLFAGKSVYVFGDCLQLPPVDKKSKTGYSRAV